MCVFASLTIESIQHLLYSFQPHTTEMAKKENQHIGSVWLQYSEDCTQYTQEGLPNNMFLTLCILCKLHVYHSMTVIARLHSGINTAKLYLAVLTLVHSLTLLLLLRNTSQQVCNTLDCANHMFIPAVIRMAAPLSCLEPQDLKVGQHNTTNCTL